MIVILWRRNDVWGDGVSEMSLVWWYDANGWGSVFPRFEYSEKIGNMGLEIKHSTINSNYPLQRNRKWNVEWKIEMSKKRCMYGHFFDLCWVEAFNFFEDVKVFVRDKIDRDTLPSKSSGTSNSVNVFFVVLFWNVIVDDQRHLVNICKSLCWV